MNLKLAGARAGSGQFGIFESTLVQRLSLLSAPLSRSQHNWRKNLVPGKGYPSTPPSVALCSSRSQQKWFKMLVPGDSDVIEMVAGKTRIPIKRFLGIPSGLETVENPAKTFSRDFRRCRPLMTSRRTDRQAGRLRRRSGGCSRRCRRRYPPVRRRNTGPELSGIQGF